MDNLFIQLRPNNITLNPYKLKNQNYENNKTLKSIRIKVHCKLPFIRQLLR